MTDQPNPKPDTQPLVPAPPEPEPAGAPAGAPALASSGPMPAAAWGSGTSRPRGATWVNVALAVAIAIAIGGVGFAAGRMTAPASTLGAGNGSGRTFGNGTLPGSGFQGGGDGGFRGVLGAGGASIEGTVESISGDTLTLKLASGQTIQVSLSGSTTYHSQAAASSSDVKAGGTVIVRLQLGRVQGDGATSPSATDVTIVP